MKRGKTNDKDTSSMVFKDVAISLNLIAEKRRISELTEKDTKREIGRNEPCPCGSGKKYKHCHGKIS